MIDVLYMAWRYLARHRLETAILAGSIALIVFIPVGLRLLVAQSQRQLTARADATPLLVGAKGSPLELALSALYFGAEVPASMPHGEVDRIDDSGLARPIPLHVRFRAGDDPIVGTTLDYFELRGLNVDFGRMMMRLGDCVVGAAVARRRGLAPGGSVVSSPESVFDLAGVYPLKMRVAGVLERCDGPDDHAVFVDVRTAWVIEGLGHGHQDLAAADATGGVLSRDGGRITANASVVQYNEITEENVDSFHFHGDDGSFPITAVIADAPDAKSTALLLGRYESDEEVQIVRSRLVMDELLATILTVQHLVVVALVTVGLATIATAVLVLMLSLRLRRREIETMMRIGAAPLQVVSIITCEVAIVILLGVALAAILTWLTGQYGPAVMRAILLQ